MTEDVVVTDNVDAGRFELTIDGQTAYTEYRLLGPSIILTHTETPPELQGRGVGSALACGVLGSARERGLQVVPLCPFIAGYMRAHPAYLDLLSESNRRRLVQGIA